MKALGLDLSTHRAQRLTPELVEQADLIVPMTHSHFREIVRDYPESREKILMLGSFLVDDGEPPADIHDPAGCLQEVYDDTRDLLARAVERLVAFMTRME